MEQVELYQVPVCDMTFSRLRSDLFSHCTSTKSGIGLRKDERACSATNDWLNSCLAVDLIPYGLQFVSWLLCFPSNSLLESWEDSRGWSIETLHPHGRSGRSFWLLASGCQLLVAVSDFRLTIMKNHELNCVPITFAYWNPTSLVL